MSIRHDLKEPYWCHAYDPKSHFPGLDFNREIVMPGTNETFPDGAVGIRVDDDFWEVAALPWKYRDTPLEEIVGELWPEYVAEGATFEPDSDAAIGFQYQGR
jgi:hypothetical protein